MIVYFLFVRVFLIKRDENNNTIYINVWPVWLSLDNLIYRPLVLKILPFVGAFVARVAASIVDWIVLFVRTILMKNAPTVVVPPEDKTFGVYECHPKNKKSISSSLAYSLLLFGTGVTVTLVYLLVF